MTIHEALQLKFVDILRDMGGEVFVVGGCVRDFFLHKPSKDIDFLVRNIDKDELLDTLSKLGWVDAVGESFGVLKFIPNDIDLDEPFDIALPRKERLMNEQEVNNYFSVHGIYPNSHQRFIIDVDKIYTLEDDLIRRDFTMNAIAFDGMKYHDLFGGISDITKKIIRCVDEKAFVDDPLRMLRAVQFASRFNFSIEPTTLELIINNSYLIKTISSERLIMEYEKIVNKGDVRKAIDLLIETNLGREIFGFDITINNEFDYNVGIGEMFFIIHNNSNINSSDIIDYLKSKYCLSNTEIDVFEALHIAHNCTYTDLLTTRLQALKTYKLIGNSDVKNIPIRFQDELKVIDILPKSTHDLVINGKDLMQMGLLGKEIGIMQKKMFHAVLVGEVENEVDDLKRLINDRGI